MSAPRQMTSETLNALKGWGANLHAVDFDAKLNSRVTDRLPPGSVVHVDSGLTFTPGVGNTVVMPMFTFQASDDPDVANDGGDPATEKGVWVPITPSGNINALVAIGAYELVSTNYNTAGVYAPNTPLTSPLVAGGGVTPGMLTPGTIQTDTIVGLVSRGVVDNGYGYNAVAFWPWFLPALS